MWTCYAYEVSKLYDSSIVRYYKGLDTKLHSQEVSYHNVCAAVLPVRRQAGLSF